MVLYKLIFELNNSYNIKGKKGYLCYHGNNKINVICKSVYYLYILSMNFFQGEHKWCDFVFGNYVNLYANIVSFGIQKTTNCSILG